ncbi:hypothetical protein OROGR_009077 [Orobanche gracilis]
MLKVADGDLFTRNGRWNFNNKVVVDVFEESQQFRRAPPMVRVEKMFEEVQSKLPGPWKRKTCLILELLLNAWLAPMIVNDQYLTNLMLKINDAKISPSIPVVSKSPNLILGMDVSPGYTINCCLLSAQDSDSGLQFLAIEPVCAQSTKVEMIDSLYKRVRH